jgi:CRP-like cAMP-binding protein
MLAAAQVLTWISSNESCSGSDFPPSPRGLWRDRTHQIKITDTVMPARGPAHAGDGTEEPRQSRVRNRLLQALEPADYARLAPHLRAMDLPLARCLVAPNEVIGLCVFPESGFVSVATAHGQQRVEIGLVGNEGLVGAAPVLLADAMTPHTHVVQMAGSGLAIAAGSLGRAAAESASLRGRLLAYVQTQLIQLGETAHAHAALNLESRLARWLLMCHDRVEGDELALTHEFLSMMLGVQRAGVTLALQSLEGAGLIRNRRKRVLIRDRAGLEALTHGSYGAPEAAYARLIAPAEAAQASARGVALSSAQSNSSSSR